MADSTTAKPGNGTTTAGRRTRSSDGGSLGTIATSVYQRLRVDILSGGLTPGEKLRVEFVRERYAAGNSPVREALNRLSAEGLVERREQRGFYVAAISDQDLKELTKTRCWLETIALRESIANHTADWEEGVVLAFHRLSRTPRSISETEYQSNPEWEARHRAFHRALVANCGSRWLVEFCESLADQAYRYREIAVANVFPKRHEADEHREIMDATIDGDTEAAVALLVRHYERTAAIVQDSLGGSATPDE
jgi:DNA-binding GntR family transcriptional regulator